jgi:hypothetical protein
VSNSALTVTATPLPLQAPGAATAGTTRPTRGAGRSGDLGGSSPGEGRRAKLQRCDTSSRRWGALATVAAVRRNMGAVVSIRQGERTCPIEKGAS